MMDDDRRSIRTISPAVPGRGQRAVRPRPRGRPSLARQRPLPGRNHHQPRAAGPRPGALELLRRHGRLLPGGQRHPAPADGRFRTVGASLRYSALDQYLMGLRDASEVPPFFFVQEPPGHRDTDPGRKPATGVVFSGTRKDVTIADIVAALGDAQPAGARRGLGPSGRPSSTSRWEGRRTRRPRKDRAHPRRLAGVLLPGDRRTRQRRPQPVKPDP